MNETSRTMSYADQVRYQTRQNVLSMLAGTRDFTVMNNCDPVELIAAAEKLVAYLLKDLDIEGKPVPLEA